ncbi:hypothetical protein [Sulfurospirillum arsenophilum]|uniref:hypothetical protein n=1 Tax=Sulfurospirillum arsenophilum TaxID=56698 RepID=UPI0005A92310|nr:hypothetical protein [Sulfurospirillum arsenophilum]
MNLNKIALLSSALIASLSFAETKIDYVLMDPRDLPKDQYTFRFQLEKNGELIAGSSVIFSSERPSSTKGGGTGSATKMYYYNCDNGERDSKPYSQTVLINDYPTLDCLAKDNGDATCTVKLYNAKDQNALVFEEYNKKSCKKIEPIISVQEFTLNLNATDKNGIKDFGNGYKLHYVYREFQ